MIQEVTSVKLPARESISIIKNHLAPEDERAGMTRLSIVTGIHGDELDGQYVCYELVRRINENRERLKGIVDIYPCVNPLGMDNGTRGIPMFDLDMNRVFPGDDNGAMPEVIAARLVGDIAGSSLCVDMHSSNVFIKEAPQLRINNEDAEVLLPYARLMNADFVWVYSSITVREATLAYSLNKLGVPTIVSEMGGGLRISQDYCRQLIDGIFNLMIGLGIWEGESPRVREPIISTEGEVAFIGAGESGVFIPATDGRLGKIRKGDHIGDIISPVEGKILQRLESPADGIIFTVRENPVAYKGALIARMYVTGH
jgi:predicted deacylase